MNTFYKLFIALLFSFLSSFAAQPEFKQGYIITNKNDTVRGLISNSHQDAYLFVDFKLNTQAKDTVYSPKFILGYAVENEVFRTVHIPFNADTLYSFAKVLEEGNITLYKTKLKLDALLKAKEAYLYVKSGEIGFKPAGKVNSLLPAIEDNVELTELVKNHYYKDNEMSKILVCKKYNESYKK